MIRGGKDWNKIEEIYTPWYTKSQSPDTSTPQPFPVWSGALTLPFCCCEHSIFKL